MNDSWIETRGSYSRFAHEMLRTLPASRAYEEECFVATRVLTSSDFPVPGPATTLARIVGPHKISLAHAIAVLNQLPNVSELSGSARGVRDVRLNDQFYGIESGDFHVRQHR